MQSKRSKTTLPASNPQKPTDQNRPELLAPAGSFSAAYHAFQAGADAVYFGLKDFSARKGALNFTMDEVARLKALAESKGKRIYAALNTVIREQEVPALASALYDLESLEVDGVIIQDLGVLYLVRHWFPRLPLHASTQMAVHNSAGVETLKRLGVCRFILSRELTLEELRAIRQKHPEVELEVFIHGALCYSISGLCLASGLLLGRSGNRGECAQLCRSWFTSEPSIATAETASVISGVISTHRRKRFSPVSQSSNRSSQPLEGYFFSCKDLALGEAVLRLREIGIDAFKIEGRLKAPEWVAAVTSYYRSILDKDARATQNQSSLANLLDSHNPADTRSPKNQLERACWIFSRSLTKGFLANEKKSVPPKEPPTQLSILKGFPGILDPRFPGHRGIPIGKVLAVEGKYFLLKPERGLSVRDGLQFFRPLSGLRTEAVPFGIERIHPATSTPFKPGSKRSKPILSCQAGQSVWIEAPEPPPVGSDIYLISTHADALPEAPGNIPRKRIPIELSVELCLVASESQEAPKQNFWLTINLHVVNNRANRSTLLEPLFIWEGVVPTEKARSGLGVEEVFTKFLSPPGDSLFQLTRVSTTGSLNDLPAQDLFNSDRPPGIFIPPSKLKEIRREVYQKAAEAWMRRKETYLAEILGDRSLDGGLHRDIGMHSASGAQPPIRVSIPSRYKLYSYPSGLPFVTEEDLSSPEAHLLTPINGSTLDPLSGTVLLKAQTKTLYLPLPPVLFHPEPFWERLERFILTHLQEEPDVRIYLGLNNIGHLSFACRFQEEERVRFFIDYGLYMANRFALRMVWELLPRVDFYYPWIEEPFVGRDVPPDPKSGQQDHASLSSECPAGDYGTFKPPLFMGRACVYRSLPGERSCASCPMPITLRQGNRVFILRSAKVGGSCLNLLFQES